jgi:rhomboid protease GluP
LNEAPPSPVDGAGVAATTPVAATVIALRRRPAQRRLGSALVFVLLGMAPALLLPLAWFASTGALSLTAVLAIVAVAALAALGWLVSLFWLPAPRPLILDDNAASFSWGRGEQRLALDDLVVARLHGRDLLLLTGVPRGAHAKGDLGTWLLPRRVFVDDDGPQRVLDALRARLQRHPDGVRLSARLADNAERQRRFDAVRPLVTWTVVAVCVAVFVGEVVTGALFDVDVLLRWGANSGARVRDGEVWRVVTACLLHGNLLHLVMNATSLWPVGAVVERWIGRPAMIVVLFASGAGGHLASALVGRSPVSVGISGAVFGLLGVLLVSSIRFRGQTTGGLKVRLSSWLFLLITNALLSLIPFVDVVAHGAGFVAGAVVGVALSPRPVGAPVVGQRVQRALAAVGVGLTVIAILVAAVSATH